MSADSIAISVPDPIASPTSALANAGLSFIPSPTKATFLFCFCNFETSFSFSCGNTSEIILFICKFFPICSATILLSPCYYCNFYMSSF